jgi:tripartite-type tricarboxylate transporter receptor subunit TctC
MLNARSSFSLCALGAVCLSAAAPAQTTYPTRPIRIVTSEPGGANDIAARLIAPGLASALGQQVIIDNRPAGVIPSQIVSKSASDGHTLLVTTSLLWILPQMQSTSFDPMRDFAPVVLVANTPNILVTHPSLPVKTVRDLIALAKARPGELDYASGALGSSSHLAAELFKSMAGVKMVRVPFRGAGPAVLGLVSGQAQLMFGSASSVRPHFPARLRAIAVSTATPSSVFPELPTIAESGVKGYQTVTPLGIFAPAGTPPSIVNRLNAEIVQILRQSDVNSRFLSMGVEVVASSPEEFGAFMKADALRMGKVIKAAGIRAE